MLDPLTRRMVRIVGTYCLLAAGSSCKARVASHAKDAAAGDAAVTADSNLAQLTAALEQSSQSYASGLGDINAKYVAMLEPATLPGSADGSAYALEGGATRDPVLQLEALEIRLLTLAEEVAKQGESQNAGPEVKAVENAVLVIQTQLQVVRTQLVKQKIQAKQGSAGGTPPPADLAKLDAVITKAEQRLIAVRASAGLTAHQGDDAENDLASARAADLFAIWCTPSETFDDCASYASAISGVKVVPEPNGADNKMFDYVVVKVAHAHAADARAQISDIASVKVVEPYEQFIKSGFDKFRVVVLRRPEGAEADICAAYLSLLLSSGDRANLVQPGNATASFGGRASEDIRSLWTDRAILYGRSKVHPYRLLRELPLKCSDGTYFVSPDGTGITGATTFLPVNLYDAAPVTGGADTSAQWAADENFQAKGVDLVVWCDPSAPYARCQEAVAAQSKAVKADYPNAQKYHYIEFTVENRRKYLVKSELEAGASAYSPYVFAREEFTPLQDVRIVGLKLRPGASTDDCFQRLRDKAVRRPAPDGLGIFIAEAAKLHAADAAFAASAGKDLNFAAQFLDLTTDSAPPAWGRGGYLWFRSHRAAQFVAMASDTAGDGCVSSDVDNGAIVLEPQAEP